MIKGIKHMYAIDQSKLRESKTFSSLRSLQKVFSSKGLVKISAVVEPPELFQLKCLSPALEARPHLNRNNPSVPRI
jgi:hypothetical protein